MHHLFGRGPSVRPSCPSVRPSACQLTAADDDVYDVAALPQPHPQTHTHTHTPQALKANPESAVKELKLNNNYITRFGQVALTEAVDLVYEMGGGNMLTVTF